jgi:hypothetical protein
MPPGGFQPRPCESRPFQCRLAGFNTASVIAYCLKELTYVNIYCSEISFGIYRVPPVLDTFRVVIPDSKYLVSVKFFISLGSDTYYDGFLVMQIINL